MFEVLRSQGLQAHQQVEFFTDGAPILRSLTRYLSPESTLALVNSILDWFHLTMRLMVLKQSAWGLTQVDAPSGNALLNGLTSIKWHGNAERAVRKIADREAILATHQEDQRLTKHTTSVSL